MAIFVYQVFLKETDDYYEVRVPAFNQCTQGSDLIDAIIMARDIIGITGIDLEDTNKTLPPSCTKMLPAKKGEISTLIDIDFDTYRKKMQRKYVKKNCTIPAYLEEAAEERGLNFSKVLAEALANKLDYSVDFL